MRVSFSFSWHLLAYGLRGQALCCVCGMTADVVTQHVQSCRRHRRCLLVRNLCMRRMTQVHSACASRSQMCRMTGGLPDD